MAAKICLKPTSRPSRPRCQVTARQESLMPSHLRWERVRRKESNLTATFLKNTKTSDIIQWRGGRGATPHNPPPSPPPLLLVWTESLPSVCVCLSSKHSWSLPLTGRRSGDRGKKKGDTIHHSGFQSHLSPWGVNQNVSVGDTGGREWERRGMFPFTFFLSAEAGPAREPEKNTESASLSRHLLNSSLIRDNCWSVCHTS